MTPVPASPRSPNIALLLGLAWLVVVAQLLADHWSETAQTFPDMDDAMRMVEVRGFLGGAVGSICMRRGSGRPTAMIRTGRVWSMPALPA